MISYIKFSDEICVASIPKCGSTSLMTATKHFFKDTPCISPKKALTFSRRVAFFKDPIKRFRSCFSFLWGLEAFRSDYNMIPKNLIKCYSIPFRGLEYKNELSRTPEWEDDYLSEIANVTDWQELDRMDYRRFVDYVLSCQTPDEHFAPQTSLIVWDGSIVPNELYNIDKMVSFFESTFDVPIGKDNTSKKICRDYDYRLDELLKYYVNDYDFLGDVIWH